MKGKNRTIHPPCLTRVLCTLALVHKSQKWRQRPIRCRQLGIFFHSKYANTCTRSLRCCLEEHGSVLIDPRFPAKTATPRIRRAGRACALRYGLNRLRIFAETIANISISPKPTPIAGLRFEKGRKVLRIARNTP